MAFLFFSCSSDKDSQRYVHTFEGNTMGTTYNVKISHEAEIFDTQKIQTEVDKLLQDINSKMSTYIEDSELSLVNFTKSQNWLTISKDLYFVLRVSKEISRLSDSYFDITVGPLVNLWGFGPMKRQKPEPPSDVEIKEVLEYVGQDKFELNLEEHSLKKKHPKVYLDLSGIAKGYAVDEVSKLLTSLGLTSHLVEIGGELRAAEKKSSDSNWKVGIESPGSRNAAIIFPLEKMSLATSGNYKQYIRSNKKRYGHTIDPKSGQATYRSIVSASVLHLSCTQADAWATAFMAMGIEKALESATKNGLAAYFIVKDQEEKVSEVMSPKFKELGSLKGKL
jgi:thiamine biosynthesis lipoprotein